MSSLLRSLMRSRPRIAGRPSRPPTTVPFYAAYTSRVTVTGCSTGISDCRWIEARIIVRFVTGPKAARVRPGRIDTVRSRRPRRYRRHARVIDAFGARPIAAVRPTAVGTRPGRRGNVLPGRPGAVRAAGEPTGGR